MKRYGIVFLDADETLFDFARAEDEALRRAFELRGLAPSEGAFRDYLEINAELWRRLERGEVGQGFLRTERFRLLFERRGLDLDAGAFGEDYVGLLAEQAFLLPGAEELCAYLASKYRLAIVTNGIAEVQRGRLGRSPIRGGIELLVVSEEAGWAKPDPRIFARACELLGLSSPSERDKAGMLMVGDSLSSDIRGAASFGIDSCWINWKGAANESGIAPTYEVRDLAALRALL